MAALDQLEAEGERLKLTEMSADGAELCLTLPQRGVNGLLRHPLIQLGLSFATLRLAALERSLCGEGAEPTRAP